MLIVVQATEVFIGDLSVSPAEDYSQLQLNYQTTYQQFYMEHIAIYNLAVLIFDWVCIGLASLNANEGQWGQIKPINASKWMSERESLLPAALPYPHYDSQHSIIHL